MPFLVGFLVGVLSRALLFLLSSIMHPKVKTRTRATIANSKSENIFSCFLVFGVATLEVSSATDQLKQKLDMLALVLSLIIAVF